ncbi:hypothetical protein [Frankia sp. Mgl5]|uniref:hypothetical protein n=1 Tax=Frankia sp. Mgl5 TaxID=2933793 RepID=UPI00200F4747|nr:hypothetical protein [Frankia sp. Mgl5]
MTIGTVAVFAAAAAAAAVGGTIVAATVFAGTIVAVTEVAERGAGSAGSTGNGGSTRSPGIVVATGAGSDGRGGTGAGSRSGAGRAAAMTDRRRAGVSAGVGGVSRCSSIACIANIINMSAKGKASTIKITIEDTFRAVRSDTAGHGG